MNITSHPVIHLPIPILEIICNDLAADVQRSWRIIAAMEKTSVLAQIVSTAPAFEVIPAPPLKCKHGLREAWCAICKKKDALHRLSEFDETSSPIARSVQYQDEPLFALKPKSLCRAWQYALAPVDVKCVERRVKKGALNYCPLGEQFANYCLPGEKFTPEPNKPWSEEEELARLHVSPIEPRFNKVTPEDVAWAERQAAFPHSQPMPRLRMNFCPNCTEVVTAGNSVLRTTKGMYLPIEHKCGTHVVNGVPAVTKQKVVNRLPKVRTEEAAQSRFEDKNIVFVGVGADVEVLDSFKYDPKPNHSDQRHKDLMGWAQRLSHVGVVVGPTCLRCQAPITARKGTKYCTDDCRKRKWEATNINQGEN